MRRRCGRLRSLDCDIEHTTGCGAGRNYTKFEGIWQNDGRGWHSTAVIADGWRGSQVPRRRTKGRTVSPKCGDPVPKVRGSCPQSAGIVSFASDLLNHAPGGQLSIRIKLSENGMETWAGPRPPGHEVPRLQSCHPVNGVLEPDSALSHIDLAILQSADRS